MTHRLSTSIAVISKHFLRKIHMLPFIQSATFPVGSGTYWHNIARWIAIEHTTKGPPHRTITFHSVYICTMKDDSKGKRDGGGGQEKSRGILQPQQSPSSSTMAFPSSSSRSPIVVRQPSGHLSKDERVIHFVREAVRITNLRDDDEMDGGPRDMANDEDLSSATKKGDAK